MAIPTALGSVALRDDVNCSLTALLVDVALSTLQSCGSADMLVNTVASVNSHRLLLVTRREARRTVAWRSTDRGSGATMSSKWGCSVAVVVLLASSVGSSVSTVLLRSSVTESRTPQRAGEREAVGDDDVVSWSVDETVTVVERGTVREAVSETDDDRDSVVVTVNVKSAFVKVEDDVRACVCVTLSSPRDSDSTSVVVTLDVAVRDAVASAVLDAVSDRVVSAVSDTSGDIVTVDVGPSAVSDAVSVDAAVLERVGVAISVSVRVGVIGRSAVSVAGVAVRTTETHKASGESLSTT
jgi:hypothetical protein